MTPSIALAVLCGLGLGFGCWSLVSLVPMLNRPRLLYRVAPYLVDVSPGARDLLARQPVNPLPVFGTVLAPVHERVSSLLGAVVGGTEVMRLRLRQSGSRVTAEEYRARQVLWALAGIALGTVVSIVAVRLHDIPVPVLVAVVGLAGIGVVLARDAVLQRAARSRMNRMTAELPTVLEFLTLSLSAGEGVLDALRRVARISHGELAVELADTVAAVNTGVPFSTALQALADDLKLTPFSRCVEQILGALERGTPLAEVLRAQAQDARDDAKRDLLETAGKKEVAMLVPVKCKY